jgi:uncharacterized protein YgbK (DUF1537 family)
MFLVIADDLTGAAEMGGVAVRHGLEAEVQIGSILESRAEVVAVDTDSRSCPEEEAAGRIRALGLPQSGWVFKKVDSVLRGHVMAELAADASSRAEQDLAGSL